MKRKTGATPDHSSLSKIGDRLPVEVYEEVFGFVLKRVHDHGLLSGKTVGVDSTFIEANAAMNRCERTMRHGGVSTDRRLVAGGSLSMNRPCRIVRKESGEDWRA